MVRIHELSRRDARRIAVRAQLLDRERPSDLHEVVHRLTLLQIDPIKAVAPSADLVLWSRLGTRAYQPGDLRGALDEQRLVELQGLIRPIEDLVLHRAEMAAWPGAGNESEWHEHLRAWVAVNDRTRTEILERLRMDAPLSAKAFPDTCERPWRSSGWNNNKNIGKLLDMMVRRGEVAVSGREGRERLFDLAERVYPDEPVVPLEDAFRERDRRRLRSLGIARATGTELPMEASFVGEAGEPAVVEGTKGEWRVDPAFLDPAFLDPAFLDPAFLGPAFLDGAFRGRAALLSPYDRLLYDRKRAEELFGFEFHLEMYKPAAKRRWGYYALPILYGDRLVGKLDAKAEPKEGVLVVRAVHEDEPFTATVRTAVDREIEELATWLGLETYRQD